MSELSGIIASMVEESVLSVFDTMASLPGESVTKAEDLSDIQVNGVGGFVNFGGSLSGVVYLLMSDELANKVACSMLGSDKADPAEVRDVIGELTNMVAGGLKNNLATAGYESVLTIPTFIRAENSKINVRNVTVATNNIIRLPSVDASVQVRVLARKAA